MYPEVIGILEGRDFSKKGIDLLAEYGEVKVYDSDHLTLESFLHDVTVIFIRLAYRIDEEFLSKAINLKYICTPTTGLTHIDENAVRNKGISILSLKGEYEFLTTIRATPEHAFGLVLSLLRNYKSAYRCQNRKRFDREIYKGHEIYGLDVGIIGYGRVGRQLSKYFQAFDARCRYYDIDDSKDGGYGAERVSSLTELIQKSQLIILAASYEGYEVMDADSLDMMKDKYFVNIARGELVDEHALIKLLEKDHFKGAALDVIANETKAKNNLDRFIAMSDSNSLLLTPHMAGATYDSMERTELFIIKRLFEKIGIL